MHGLWVKLTGLLIALAIVIGLSFAHAQHRDTFAVSAGGGGAVPRGTPDSLRLSRLADLADGDASEQLVAKSILNSLMTPPTTGAGAYLAIAVTPEARIENGTTTLYCQALPVVTHMANQYARRSELGAPDILVVPAGTTIDFGYSSLTWQRSTGNPSDAVHTWSVNLGAVGLIILPAWLLWMAARSVPHWVDLWIARRRRGNRCIACGHALGPPPAPQ